MFLITRSRASLSAYSVTSSEECRDSNVRENEDDQGRDGKPEGEEVCHDWVDKTELVPCSAENPTVEWNGDRVCGTVAATAPSSGLVGTVYVRHPESDPHPIQVPPAILASSSLLPAPIAQRRKTHSSTPGNC